MANKRPADEAASGSSPSKVLKDDSQPGTSGLKVQLAANYFKMITKPDFFLSQYYVKFDPEVDNLSFRKKILRENKEKFALRYLYDGGSLFCTHSIDARPFKVSCDGRDYEVQILRTDAEFHSDSPESFQIFNLILRDSIAALKLENVRRDYFDPNKKIEIREGKLELWPGYKTSIRAHETEILLNAEVSHKVMRLETVLDVAKKFLSKGADWKENLKKEIIGTTVLTDYNNKTYLINDIEFGMNPKMTFKRVGTEDVTFIEYYKNTYNKKIADEDQFLLSSKTKQHDVRDGRPEFIYLIPELCRTTGMTDEMLKNFNLMKKLSNYTRMDPKKRVEALQSFNTRIQNTPESVEVLEDWQMQLDTNLVKVTGRELPPETLVFGDSSEYKVDAKGEWKLGRGTKFFKSAEIIRWVVIYPKTMEEQSASFVSELAKCFGNMGNKESIKDPKHIVLNNEEVSNYLRQIEDVAKKDPTMILCILPSNRADRYSAIKKKCLIELGIPTQIVIKRSIEHKSVGSIAEKVAVQLNAKFGGIPWMIKLPVNGLMTVGFDVSLHPKEKSRSSGALVATMDLKKSGAFYSVTSSYRDGIEMNAELAKHMEKALEMYKNTCLSYPERIVFYRDGVGEGQLNQVMRQEVEPLLVKLTKIFCDDPKLAYIIVNKRSNTRLFKKQGSLTVNPKPGTVVDTEITLPNHNDFFLISQHVSTGTVSPTNYNIIYNSTGLSKDRLEILTYKFTHLYFNWCGTTRVPFVSQLAKKLAFLTSQSIEKPVNKNVAESLYFL